MPSTGMEIYNTQFPKQKNETALIPFFITPDGTSARAENAESKPRAMLDLDQIRRFYMNGFKEGGPFFIGDGPIYGISTSHAR